MHRSKEIPATSDARTLILSLRNFERHASFCIMNECEQIIRSIDRTDFVTPTMGEKGLFGFDVMTANAVLRNTGLGYSFNPAAESFISTRSYDLFFFYCQYPKDLLFLNAIPQWRKICRKAVCWLDEFWIERLQRGGKNTLKLLRPFDKVFMSLGTSVAAVNRATNLDTDYMPYGVDAIKFCPLPAAPDRIIDVYSVGRRPEPVHRGLLELADRGDFYYLYDTFSDMRVVKDRREDHRSLYANTLKRSRYFITYKGKFDQPKGARTQEVTGARYFEGAAAGAVMIGIPPADPAFSRLFDWRDVVLEVPVDCADMKRRLAEFDARGDSLEQIRRDNVVNSLLRHDWVYRWERILESVGMEPLLGLEERKQRLSRLASIAGGEASGKVRILRDGLTA